MKVIICIDNHDGVMFNNRRQSRDKVVTNAILHEASGTRLVITPYTKGFIDAHIKRCGYNPDNMPEMVVTPDPISVAQHNDVVFLEDKASKMPINYAVGTLILFRWNRDYPSDQFFDRNKILGLGQGWTKENTIEFIGSSHDLITQETYVR